MALKFSTCLRNKLLGAVPVAYGASISVSSRIAAVSGATDSFTDSGSGFVTAGFAAGDTIMVSGFSIAANNGIFTIKTVAAGTIEIEETTVVDEAAGSLNIKIQVIKGGSLKDIFKDGIIRIYNGMQPASPDSSTGGATPLVEITVASGSWSAGSPANGLEFGTASYGSISKSSDVWSGVASASGTAGWFRFYANASDSGAADTTYIYPRMDGSVGTGSRELNMSSTSLTAGATVTIDTFKITLPES